MRLFIVVFPLVIGLSASLPVCAQNQDLSSQILARYYRLHPVATWSYDWTSAIFLYGAGQAAVDGNGSIGDIRSALTLVEKSRPSTIDSPDRAAMSLAANLLFDRSAALVRIVDASKTFFTNEPLNAGGVFDHVGRNSRLHRWLPPSSLVFPSSVWADSSIMYALNGLLIAIREKDAQHELFFVNQLLKIHGYLWDQRARLYKHAYFFGSKSFAPADGYWARGNMWMALAFLRAAEALPAGSRAREQFSELLQNHVASLEKRANKTWGLRTLLDQPAETGNIYETTASALFAYVLMRGARDGVLTTADGAHGRELAQGLRNVLKQASSGEISVTGISCPTTAMTWTWYYTHAVGECADESYGVGAYLMMLAEAKH